MGEKRVGSIAVGALQHVVWPSGTRGEPLNSVLTTAYNIWTWDAAYNMMYIHYYHYLVN